MVQGLILPKVNVRLDKRDFNKLQRRLMAYANNLRREFDGFDDELGRIGQTYARSIAPRDLGYLHQSIKWRTKDTNTTIIRIDKATLNKNPTNKRNVNYVAIMHIKDGKMGNNVNIHTGDPRFLVTTKNYLERVMGREIKIKLGKL